MIERVAVVLDASALLALLNKEPGHRVETYVLQGDAAMSAVNLSEVIAKHAERGVPSDRTASLFHLLGIKLHTFDAEDAELAGSLRTRTKTFGLSLGDWACLALAIKLKLPVVTADQAWNELGLPVDVIQIR